MNQRDEKQSKHSPASKKKQNKQRKKEKHQNKQKNKQKEPRLEQDFKIGNNGLKALCLSMAI